MKNFIGLFSLLLLTVGLNAQINTPSASPKSTVTQMIGLTEATVVYSRPSMKDRTIFSNDGLVPFGKLWRTGANAVTKITFSDDVTVGGSKLAAGSYAILTVPNASEWIINFYTYEKSSWSSYTEANPTASVRATPEMMPSNVETFTIVFGDLKSDSGLLEILWEKTYLSVKIGVTVDDRVMADIEKTLAGPTGNDYYAAGNYYHTSGKDLATALKYVQMATSVEKPKFWQVRRESLILADMGKYDDAIKAAKKSMDLAKAAGNDDYVKMNQESINEWITSGK